MNSMAIPLCIHISYRDCKKPWSTRIYPLTMGVVIIHVWFSHYRSSPVSTPSTYNGRPDTPITGKSQGHWENHWGTTKLARRVRTKKCNANCQRKEKSKQKLTPLETFPSICWTSRSWTVGGLVNLAPTHTTYTVQEDFNVFNRTCLLSLARRTSAKLLRCSTILITRHTRSTDFD